jgi:hypothetical protein
VRVRTVIDRLVWVAVIGFLVYAAVVGGTSYFETRQLVDQAVFEAGRRPRAAAAVGQPSVSTLQEFAVDTREAILVAARRSSVPLDVSKLTVTPEGAGIRVSLHWSYVLLEIANETVLAVPLWLDRTFDLKP